MGNDDLNVWAKRQEKLIENMAPCFEKARKVIENRMKWDDNLHEWLVTLQKEKRIEVLSKPGGNYGNTLMGQAALEGLANLIPYFIKLGAPIEQADKVGQTPLVDAIRAGALNCVEALIEGGAKVNVQIKYGLTPLHYAAGSGGDVTDKIFNAVLEAGADVDAKNDKGETPRDRATESQLNIVKDYEKTINNLDDSGPSTRFGK